MAWHAHLQPPAHNRHVRSESGAAEHAQRRPPEVFAAALCVRHAPTSPSAHAGTGGIGGSTAPAASTQKRRPSADGRCTGARCMLSRLCAPGCDPICVRLAAIQYVCAWLRSNTTQYSRASLPVAVRVARFTARGDEAVLVCCMLSALRPVCYTKHVRSQAQFCRLLCRRGAMQKHVLHLRIFFRFCAQSAAHRNRK
jgi:hypothetical protein